MKTRNKNKRALKRILAVFSIFIMGMNVSSTAQAKELQTNQKVRNVAEYDLNMGGKQEFTILSSQQEILYVTISEEGVERNVENGTYKVSFKSPGAWEAGYNIKVSNNKIVSANSAFNTTVLGSISSTRLIVDNSKQASYHFVYKYGMMKHATGVRSILSGDKIKVSEI